MKRNFSNLGQLESQLKKNKPQIQSLFNKLNEKGTGTKKCNLKKIIWLISINNQDIIVNERERERERTIERIFLWSKVDFLFLFFLEFDNWRRK